MNTKYKIAFSATLLVYAAYWLATLICVCPETSYVHTSNQKLIEQFSGVFAQRWSFFAPPPQRNWRVYYEFSDPTGHQLRFEVLQPVLEAKRRLAPFNEGEEILDYVLSGAVEQTNNFLSKRYSDTLRAAGAKAMEEQVDKIAMPKKQTLVDSRINLGALKTLMGYARIVAGKNGVPETYTQARIIVTSVPIAPFVARGKYPRNEILGEEKMAYETTRFEVARPTT